MLRYHRKYNKSSSCWTLEKVKEGKRYNYIPHTRIDRKSDYAVETGKTLLSENIILSTGNPQNISPTIAPLPPPATTDIVTAFKSRFEK